MRFPSLLFLSLAALAASGTLFAQGAPVLELTDFSGVWAERVHEDSYERSGGPPLGDYQGIPLNDAGRRKADSHDHSEWSLPEFQCRPHSAPWAAYDSGMKWIPSGGICGRSISNICVRWIA
jgi:hypothetical protein